MYEGKIIEYIDQRKIVLSVCIRDRGSKLQLLTLSNHEVSISPKRTLHISSATLNLSRPREEVLQELKEVEKRRVGYVEQVSAQDLWELIQGESETFAYKYLAQLSFGDRVTDDHICGLVRALFYDRVYFKMKDDFFIPNSPDKVEQIRKAREAAELREREITEGANWLKEVISDRHPEGPPLKEIIVGILIQLALYGKEAQDFKLGKEMFSRAGIKNTDQARRLLVQLAIWDEDENLDLHRLKRNIGFSSSAIEEADTVARREMETSGREDLTDLNVFTIDGPLTKDFDDALSLEATAGGYRLGIHVTDVAPFIEVDGPLDREAARRGSSIYLPATQIPMLPSSLSDNALSLTKGQNRLAISLLADFDSGWDLKGYRFAPTVIRIREQLTYEYVDAVYGDEPIFSTLYEMGQAFRQERAAAGALLIPLPELHFEVGNNSGVRLELIKQDTPARIIVAESMILYNHLAAKFAAERALPILYRCQEPPQERLLVDASNYVYYVFQQRRKLYPLLIDTIPRPHSGLGVDAYTNATSPLRRYMDLVVQRQIHSALLGKDLVYTESRLKESNVSLQPALRDIDLMRRNRMRYWILKYLATRINETFNAIVFQKLRNKYLIILTDFFSVSELPVESDQELSPGQEIKVVVKKSNAWDDLLTLGLAR